MLSDIWNADHILRAMAGSSHHRLKINRTELLMLRYFHLRSKTIIRNTIRWTCYFSKLAYGISGQNYLRTEQQSRARLEEEAQCILGVRQVEDRDRSPLISWKKKSHLGYRIPFPTRSLCLLNPHVSFRANLVVQGFSTGKFSSRMLAFLHCHYFTTAYSLLPQTAASAPGLKLVPLFIMHIWTVKQQGGNG